MSNEINRAKDALGLAWAAISDAREEAQAITPDVAKALDHLLDAISDAQAAVARLATKP